MQTWNSSRIPHAECMRCTEIVAEDDMENGICNWCLEQDHERQERTY